MADSTSAHRTVLLREAVAALVTNPGGSYVDGTFGRGGHSAAILENLAADGRLLAMDCDPAAIAYGRQRFSGEPRISLQQGNFAQLDLALADWAPVNGILLDLGVSSPQLDEAGRGFSFLKDGPLDMRMDPTTGVSAADWLATADGADIARVLWQYGEERQSRRIARAIVEHRASVPIETTAQLAAIVARALPRHERNKHPATRSFQAIRIHINGELEAIATALDRSIELLAPGGRLVVISFHSLEDRLVKQFFRRHSTRPGNRRLPPGVLPPPQLRKCAGATKPSEAEVAANPRARSAIMRVAEKCSP